MGSTKKHNNENVEHIVLPKSVLAGRFSTDGFESERHIQAADTNAISKCFILETTDLRGNEQELKIL